MSNVAYSNFATSAKNLLLYWLALVDDFRTANWIDIIPYPELVYQKSEQFLQKYALAS